MPQHLAAYAAGTNDPAAPIAITISGGEESDVYAVDIWNDKPGTGIDTTTAQDVVLKILTSSIIGFVGDVPQYGPWESSGTPLLDEMWWRARLLGKLSVAGFTTEGATGTLPLGVNSEFVLPDLEPQTGVRVELYVAAPAGQTADRVKIKPTVVGNQASSPLARFVGLATGSGVIPGDRVAGLRAILRGLEVTADDTDTVTVARGLTVHEGTEAMHLAEDITFTLADGGAVDLGAAEAYNVTLSATSAAVVVVTKGPKAEAVAFPAVPAGNILVACLTVESADGIAVTVSPSSVDQSDVKFAEFLVRDGGGLSVLVSPGDGLTDTDLRQYGSHATSVSVAAASTSRIWRLAAGSKVATLTDALPEVGADLLALVTTDGAGVTGIVDARRFAHRALTMDHVELIFFGVMTDVTPDETLAVAYAYEDFEIDEVEENLSDVDGTWTGGAIKVNVLTLAPGTPAPLGTALGTTIFTGHATDDARPSIAFDATNLRTVSRDHEVRRIVKGTRILLAFASTVTGAGGEPEQEVRVTLHVRRYR